MGYDPDTGLVFEETIVNSKKLRTSYVQKLEHGRRGSKPEYKSPRNGCLTLVDIAMRKLLCNLDKLGDDTLITVPETILASMWEKIERADLVSLHVWKLFAASYGTSSDRYFMSERNIPKMWFDVPMVITACVSPSSVWLVDLSISKATLTSQDLLALTDLVNLRFLNMVANPEFGPDGSVNDRLLRAWGVAAEQHGAFRQLEGFSFRDYKQLTPWSFASLGAFPKLESYCVLRCGISREDRETSKHNGWAEDTVHRPRNNDKTERSSFSKFVAEYAGLCTVYTEGVVYEWILLIGDYFDHLTRLDPRRSDPHPILKVKTGNSPDISKKDFEDVLCYVRTRSSRRPNVGKNDNRQERPSKRSKISASKTLDLSDVLSQF